MSTALAARADRRPADISRDELLKSGSSKKYAAHPAGTFVARCLDVIDMGEREFMEKKTQGLAIVFATDHIAEDSEDNQPILIRHFITRSLWGGGDGTSPSKHITMLREWFAMPNLTANDIPQYRTGKLVGKLATIMVKHRTSQSGRVYATIVGFGPANKADDSKAFPLARYYRPDWLHKTDVAGRDSGEAKDVFDAPSEDVTDQKALDSGEANLPAGVTSEDVDAAGRYAQGVAARQPGEPVTAKPNGAAPPPEADHESTGKSLEDAPF